MKPLQNRPRLRKAMMFAILLLVVTALLYALIQVILAGYTKPWTGFADYHPPTNNYVRGKTLWDWMELLIIPLFLAGAAFYLNRSERAVERKTADDRANLERELATDRQQEAALQTYLDRMAHLLLEKNLRETHVEEVRNVARIRTLTVLRGLDRKRKGIVLLFLYESGLLFDPVISLEGADLSGAELTGANLSRAVLSRANLTKVDLFGANLTQANLSEANLTEADLSGADLSTADLRKALLWKTQLLASRLEETNLVMANLFQTDLHSAYLFKANLLEADLIEADLTRANLTNVKVDQEQLEFAKSLRGTIMPDGATHD